MIPSKTRFWMAGMSANNSPATASASQIAPASPLFLREDEIRRGIEMLYFGYSSLTRSIDERLAAQGLGRAHHRALYFISRQPDLTVKDLLRLLAITKQSLGRVLNDLIERGYIETRQGASDRRQKLLRLSPSGVALRSTRSASIDRAHSITSRTSRVPFPVPRCSGNVMTFASRTVRPRGLCGLGTPSSSVPIAVETMSPST